MPLFWVDRTYGGSIHVQWHNTKKMDLMVCRCGHMCGYSWSPSMGESKCCACHGNGEFCHICVLTIKGKE